MPWRIVRLPPIPPAQRWIPTVAAAAPPDRVVPHQVFAVPFAPQPGSFTSWGPGRNTTPLFSRVPHQVSLAPSYLPQGDVATWGLTRDTTPRTADVQHQVYPAQTPLPQGDFNAWAPPRVEPPQPRILPHQFSSTEDFRRFDQYRITRFGGPAGFIVAPEDTTKVYPAQVYLAASRYPEGDFFSWQPPQATASRGPAPQVTLTYSRLPGGGFVAWRAPQPPPLPRRGPDAQITLTPSRLPGGGYISWRAPRAGEPVFVTAHFGPPSPTGGAGAGTPDADELVGSPSGGAGAGTPDANRFRPPSPGRVRT